MPHDSGDWPDWCAVLLIAVGVPVLAAILLDYAFGKLAAAIVYLKQYLLTKVAIQ